MDLTPFELMEMSLPQVENLEPVICSECGDEIVRGEVKFIVQDKIFHEKCHKYKPDNLVFLIPIGCENK
jgi:hypothetical protein